MVDVPVLGTGVLRRVGSSPTKGSFQHQKNWKLEKLLLSIKFKFSTNYLFKPFSAILTNSIQAFSSAGRAAALQAAGHRFESGRAYILSMKE